MFWTLDVVIVPAAVMSRLFTFSKSFSVTFAPDLTAAEAMVSPVSVTLSLAVKELSPVMDGAFASIAPFFVSRLVASMAVVAIAVMSPFSAMKLEAAIVAAVAVMASASTSTPSPFTVTSALSISFSADSVAVVKA